jgi:glutathione S-transferase
MSGGRKLYDLAAADPALRFSPFCWRSKLALAHKGLTVETIPWRFTDKDAIAFSGGQTVPVLIDGDKTVADSQAIAEYLEAAYPDAPSLFGGAQGHALTAFVRRWTEGVLQAALVKILMPDIFPLLHPKDQPYFRETRERRIGMSIEALGAQRAEHLPALEAPLATLRAVLKGQKFLGGDTPLYADHIVFGALQWAAKTSSTPLWGADDVIAHFMQAVVDYYGKNICN